MADRKMPPLPSGSVDLAALHAADAKGHDLDKAVAAATVRVEPPKPAKPAPTPVPAAEKADGKAG